MKDIRRKVKGTWWRGLVTFSYIDLNGSPREARRATDWEFATAGQAKRAADALAGAMASDRRITIVSTDATRVAPGGSPR